MLKLYLFGPTKGLWETPLLYFVNTGFGDTTIGGENFDFVGLSKMGRNLGGTLWGEPLFWNGGGINQARGVFL